MSDIYIDVLSNGFVVDNVWTKKYCKNVDEICEYLKESYRDKND